MSSVRLLYSIDHPHKTYIGFSTDLKKRFKAHNAGQSSYTANYKPWELVTYLAFQDESKARDFETYLKSHSGMAFATKRLW
ncbi:GIY-YIG nuclease family protein [Puniceicoccaceae bacterium K14]|nr:GIY-YIG nuclease family protein [Puniceicoccaceae bacterium K14]